MRKYYKKIYNISNKRININKVLKIRFNILTVAIILIFSIFTIVLFNIQVIDNELYLEKLDNLTRNVVYSNSTARGKIYDRNGNVLVDNEAVLVIYYKKPSNVSISEEIALAYKVAEIIELEVFLSVKDLKDFYILNFDTDHLITETEYQLKDERKLSNDDLYNLKIERIDENELEIFNDLDKEAAYIYNLMNKGYSFSDKIIKDEGVTDSEYAIIAENTTNLNGFNVRLDWNRVYPYEDVFRTILGSVSSTSAGLPYELKDHYLELGYSLNDRVGTSYLELEYEHLLKGEKTSYEIQEDGSKKVIDEGSRGKDIVLTIDIELQKQIEEILVEEIIDEMKKDNTTYYDKSFVVVSEPSTGEILAMAAKQVVFEDGEYKVYDYSSGIINYSVVMGSSVKGASNIVGYNYDALQIGEVRTDDCIKIADTPLKCSLAKMVSNDDITALKYSSNVYQFKTAINLGQGVYKYNQPLLINPVAFDYYRDTFASFGLGVLTGIDLPNETVGYKGSSTLAGHLLDFSIGQYDTYTTIQLSQYINTIANDGDRIQPKLLKAVYEPSLELDNLIYETDVIVMNEVETEDYYLDRVQEGFREVMTTSGTGVRYINTKYEAAGKTGTSESFVDSNNDGMIDKETLSNSFVAYAPYDNPKVSFTVVSPNIYYDEGYSNYRSYVNREIARRVSDLYFSLYP